MLIKKTIAIVSVLAASILTIDFLNCNSCQVHADTISSTETSSGTKNKELIKELSISTFVDNMSDEEIIKYRDEQIKKFEKINKHIFKVKPDFAKDLNPKAAALFVKQLNEIFESYPNITQSYVRMKEESGEIFEISLLSEKEKVDSFRQYACYYYEGRMLFNKNEFTNFNKALLNAHRDITTGWRAKADNNRLMESLAAHETGHLIQHLIQQRSNKYRFINIEYKNYDVEQKLKKSASIMKKDIIKIAKEKYGYNGDGNISEYGKTDDCEWFAELCSHYFCSKEPNQLGIAFGDFLNQQEKSFDKEIKNNRVKASKMA